MDITLLVLGWILGSIVSYFLFRRYLGRETWTIGDRVLAIILSTLFSWIGAASSLICLGILGLMNFDKPAKW